MLLKFLLLGFRSQFLYVSALVFDFPRVDDTFVLIAVLLNQNYCCRFNRGPAGCLSVNWHNTFLGLWIPALRFVQRIGIVLLRNHVYL